MVVPLMPETVGTGTFSSGLDGRAWVAEREIF